MIRLIYGVENEMCSLWVAVLTAVLLQVKTFVLYLCHYDQEVLPKEVYTDVVQGFGNKVSALQICLNWAAVLIPTFMYQSVPRLTIPPGNPPGQFFDRRIPYPSGKKKVQNPDSPGI